MRDAVTRQRRRASFRDEHGMMVVLFAIVLPLMLFTAAAVWDVGNWWTHRKHLQTKVDAAAFAGGSGWSFPCAADSDTNATGTGIVDLARQYAGPHTMASGVPSPFNATAFNPQVGDTTGADIHMVINGNNWFDDDSNPAPSENNDPAPNPTLCDSKILDVKGTESNNNPLFGLIPFFPDIKRKARVEIEEVEGLSGLLPISVRVPKPVSAAAVFYDEESGNILAGGVKYFCEQSGGFPAGPQAGLGRWTTYDPADVSGLCPSQASLTVAASTGVAIATSFRPACNAAATPPITMNCFDDAPFTTVNDLCRQGAGRVKCFYGTGTGAAQTVQSGLQFIHGYSDAPLAAPNAPPELRGAWLTGAGCTGGYGSGYFAAVTGVCNALLDARFDLGACLRGPGECFDDPSVTPPIQTRTIANTEVKYTIVYGPDNQDICDFGSTCDLSAGWSTSLSFDPQNTRSAIALRVRLKDTFVPGRPGCSNSNFNGGCEWYYTADGRQLTEPTNAEIFANPVQRSFMGDDDTSGPIKFLRLSADRGCNGFPDGTNNGVPNHTDGEAASQPFGQNHCFVVEMGLAGGVAKDQDEPPIAFNISGTSQSALLDCDPDLSNLKDEIVEGCKPFYRPNDFIRDPPCPPGVTNWNGMLAPPTPYDVEWPPYTCGLTQTTAASDPGELIAGFTERVFKASSSSPNPPCPPENTSWTGPPAKAPFTEGRNYWHDANNDIDEYTFAQDIPAPSRTNRLGKGGYDPRIVNLFMTAYDSFGGSENDLFPIVTFGTFYVTGWGRVAGGSGLTIDDPCDDGNNGNLFDGTGNEPPPDLNTSRPGTYVWGHFINYVQTTASATPSGRLCAPRDSTLPCIAVLVE